ncbi:hypothetical protein EDC94DRAFT_615126 [Helicostylum pulchrum]|nr:hypothetical protein EDC94DRAFT_615126 [Helicostylum pulchrum]
MSIEPEVPYNYADEDSDDNEDSWRDPHILLGGHATPTPTPPPQITQITATATTTTTAEAAAATTTATTTMRSNFRTSIPTRETTPSYADPSIVSDSGHRNPANYWVLPAHCNPRDVLGSNYKSRSNEIQKATGSFIEFNERLNQIDIWGDNEAVDKTKSYFDMIVSRLAERDTTSRRKTQKWGKPERELTAKERKRAEKKQARLDEEKRYQGLPAISQNYHGIFPIPDASLPIVKLLGDNESYLNQIRADCKAYLWYEPATNVIRIAADTLESVHAASKRIRNWYIRCSRKPEGGLARLVQQPSQDYLINFRTLPKGFVTFQYADPEIEAHMLERHRLLEAVTSGFPLGINDLIRIGENTNNLIDLNEKSQGTLSESSSTLNQRNKEFIENLLSRGLESMRLNDWNLRLKIRFGQICLIDYPKKGGYLTIDTIANKVFRKKLFKSALAPCISTTHVGLDSLFGFLSSPGNAIEFSDNPRTSFSITAQQYPTAAPARIPGQRNPPRGDMWNTVTEISFTEDGQRRLWNTMTDCTDLVDISCADIESRYSWDLRLQYARRLPNDDINSPHERFAHALRISSDNRLVLVTFDDYIPQIVTQKTKWRYGWNDYVVEICKDEIWDMNRVERTDRELPVDLTPIIPHRSLYKVSLYKEAWVNRLAENLDLKIGEAPTWTLRDFFASNNEDTRTLMCTVKKFSDILNSEVPLYWEAPPSLV